ncbi:hypothetical protein PX554_10380 [Sphingomonas sp. H39-1-10]|uniref:hypothetical protein n=1 Tax=Sphingomonas pollutisoli TaxID=3030829 RepID=UPI0023B8C4F7|nr:hypothetical protein [Sphingomonas pollutisoli]MDF0488536.1 hypothetical protein [Sphingomonas pollutisoli]
MSVPRNGVALVGWKTTRLSKVACVRQVVPAEKSWSYRAPTIVRRSLRARSPSAAVCAIRAPLTPFTSTEIVPQPGAAVAARSQPC